MAAGVCGSLTGKRMMGEGDESINAVLTEFGGEVLWLS